MKRDLISLAAAVLSAFALGSLVRGLGAPDLKGWTVEYHHVANGLSHSSVECESPFVDAKRRAIYCPAQDWDAQGFFIPKQED